MGGRRISAPRRWQSTYPMHPAAGAAIVGASVALAACGTPSHDPRPHNNAGPSPSAARTPVTIRLRLDRTEVVPGAAIRGVATLTNTTRRTITVETCAADGWLDVGLSNQHIGFEPACGAVACAPTVHLAPGPNRFPVAVATTYDACTQSATRATSQEPACSSNGLPPLPTGIYTPRSSRSDSPQGRTSPCPPPSSCRGRADDHRRCRRRARQSQQRQRRVR